MEIIIDKQVQHVAENCSVQEMLYLLIPHKQKGIAVAVNEIIVSRIDWESYVLKPNDRIILIKASQGG